MAYCCTTTITHDFHPFLLRIGSQQTKCWGWYVHTWSFPLPTWGKWLVLYINPPAVWPLTFLLCYCKPLADVCQKWPLAILPLPPLSTWGICCNNTVINLESCVVNCFYRLTGLYASFLKRQGHQSIFSLVKRTLWGNCKSVLDHFKGTKAMTRGIEAIAFVASVKYQAWIYSWLCIWLHLWSNFTKRRRQIITWNISLIILCVGHTRKINYCQSYS